MKDNEICWSNLSGVNRRARCDPEALQEGSAVELHDRIGIIRTRGISDMLYTTTPWCSGVSSVIRPR